MITKQTKPNQSITAPIFRPVPPALVNARTIESGFAQLDVDLVMRRTEPRRERSARTDVGRPALDARAEVFRAVGAGVELREGVEELEHVRALSRRGGFGVVCRGGVQERPGRAA